jgi:hypothetical protein
MKNWLMIIAFSVTVSSTSFADYCPPAQSINPQTPPAGWTLFLSPIFAGQNYYFVSAVHSLNPTYYQNQIFCHYETCPAFGCPNFTLLSNADYQQPTTNISPWDDYPQLANTLMCSPQNNDPTQCVFTNQQ